MADDDKISDGDISVNILDPCHYFSSRGLSWNAMLKMIVVKLEKISDIYKYLFIGKGLRGGIFTFLRDIQKPITNT